MAKVQTSKLYSPMNWFCTIWAFAVFVPLIYFPAPGILAGHPWKTELTLSFFFIVSLSAGLIFRRSELFNFSIDRKIVLWVIAPLGAFIFWSGLSALWANSTESVAHHTLVWSLYLIFFVCAARIAAAKELLKLSLTALSLVIGAIALQCVIEHIFSEQITEVFGFRFARYAEIHAALLPLFLSFVLRLRRKHLLWAVVLSSLVWLAVLFSLSRGAFFSALVGISVFVLLRLFTKTSRTEKIRLGLSVAALILIAFAVQLTASIADGTKSTTLDRLASQSAKSDSDGFSNNIRLLFGKVGLRMLRDNFLNGVGADNFGLEFNKYRAAFSADVQNKSVAGQQEERIPERAHNEFLQMLTELGAVGGIIFLLFVASIFGPAFTQLKRCRESRNNILIHAALAGIIAFLFSSLFSSFSFRLMQNGIVFFFLLALLLKNYFSALPKKEVSRQSNFKLLFASLALCFCLCLFSLSILKATSQYLVYRASNEPNLSVAENNFKQAIEFDPANASANYLYGLRLMNEGNYQESAVQLSEAVKKGLNTTPCYSLLASAQIMANDNEAAEKTLKENVEIFPYSTFAQVRYASTLKTNGKVEKAAEHFNLAAQLNSSQAEVWNLFINKGVPAANEYAASQQSVGSVENLNPRQAVGVVLLEREILHPEEFVKVKFSN